MRSLIQIEGVAHGECHAGGKAPSDAAIIAERTGFRCLRVVRQISRNPLLLNLYRLLWIIKSWWYELQIPRRSIVFLQYPGDLFSGRLGVAFFRRIRKRRYCKIITLIHDIDSLRGGGDELILDCVVDGSDVIIVHNDKMRDWFAARGIPVKKMVELGAFDYLTTAPMRDCSSDGFERSVMIAGNLDGEKARYLADIRNVKGVAWRLFGPNFNKDCVGGESVTHVGCFKPEEVPSRLDGGFGLVWDGDSIDSCSGPFGEYLRYNNPHKVSLYLASGFPVVIWREAALSKFVESEGVGITIGALSELKDALNNVSQDEYLRMVTNARRLAGKLRNGFFLSSALREAVKRIESVDV